MVVAPPKQNIYERFWSKVKILGPEDCWEWQASCTSNGYGQFSLGVRNNIGSHRFSYCLTRNIPAGWSVDHICKNRKCVNPSHLRALTVADNSRNGAITHCQHGHPFNSSNTYVVPKRGTRQCKRCREWRQLGF